MIKKYGLDVISYYLAKGRNPAHLTSVALPSPRETWDIVLQMPFEERTSLAKYMIFNYEISSRQAARLLHNVPEQHLLTAGEVAWLVITMLNDRQDREQNENVCAALINGYHCPSKADLMETIFSSGSLQLEENADRKPWVPGEKLNQALLDQIGRARLIENKMYLSQIFLDPDFQFSPEILEKYVAQLDEDDLQALLVDLHYGRKLVSESEIDLERTYLDVFVERLGVDEVSRILIPTFHTLTDLNEKAPISAANIIARLGGDLFLQKYFEKEPKHKCKIAAVMLINENNLQDYPALKHFVQSEWADILSNANINRLRFDMREYESIFNNAVSMVCQEDKTQALPMLELSLESSGFVGKEAINDFFKEIDLISIPSLSLSGTIKGIGAQRFSEIVDLTREQSKILPALFPDTNARELSRIFPQYKRHAIESDLGL